MCSLFFLSLSANKGSTLTHSPAPAFEHSSGPRNAKIAIIGEAWGQEEEKLGRPFIGWSGQELTRMLSEAGIARKDCFLSNVFAFRPHNNDLSTLCGSKAEVGGKDYPHPNLAKMGQYLRPEYFGELERLWEELSIVRPNVVVALGATATWALLGTNKIGSLRGTVATALRGGYKVLPTYHPAAILRNWSYRPITVADLMKASRESTHPDIRRPKRLILANPTLDEIENWIAQNLTSGLTACDIETKGGFIEMIGFSAGPERALVVPFYDAIGRKNFWPDLGSERKARDFCQTVLANPRIWKIFQNGLYDLQYLIREGYRPRSCLHDTMLLHHSIFPEMQKGLGFLGSVYCNEPAWKSMRGKALTEFKKDD
jgi:uracil-DNA glycosylase